ncbi:FUSC family protein [Saccharopolyspora sp. CA-218241]|uniref:FUSC family protein n=1 Tax=Saccharopolyspora sp. CA-218241 TaxID=3240027 RepID=UPI003D99F196
MNQQSSRWSTALHHLKHVLRARDALRVTTPIGGVLVPALRVGVSMAIPILLLVSLDRIDLVPFAALGSFTSLYCRVDTYSRRAWLQLLTAVGIVAGVAVGAITSAASGGDIAKVLAVAAVATAAKLFSDSLALGAPGGLMFAFAAGAAAYVPQQWSDVALHVGVAAGSAALSYALSMAGGVLHPSGPQRVATARAASAVADHLERGTPASRHHAHAAVQRAMGTLSSGRATHDQLRGHLLHARRVLHRPEPGAAATLRELAARVRRGRVPESGGPGAEVEVRSPRRPPWQAVQPHLPNAARMAVAALVSGLLVAAVHPDHAYWAVVSASSVLQATNATGTWHRALQRMCGTVAGGLITLVVFSFDPGPLVIIAVVVLAQVAAELVVMSNYALGLTFATPIALSLVALRQPGESFALVTERVGTTLVGAAIGTAVSLLLINRHIAHRLEHALLRCERAQAELRSCDPERLTPARAGLLSSVFALRDAHSLADGELWPRQKRTQEVLDTEHRAYELLAESVPVR